MAELNDWHLAENKASSYDTVASNSEVPAEAAVLIEEKMAKELLHLACQNHTFQINFPKTEG